MTIGKEVMLVIPTDAVCAAIDEVVAVAATAVSQTHSQTTSNGTAALAGLTLHPQQGGIAILVGGNTFSISGKTRAPHLRQHIEVAAGSGREQAGYLVDVFLWLCPANVGL